MTDDEIISHAQELCERGRPALGSNSHAEAAAQIAAPRLRTIVDINDQLEARCMVPALLEIIERRGLGPEPTSTTGAAPTHHDTACR